MNSRVILIIYLVIVNMISLGFMAADKIRAIFRSQCSLFLPASEEA